MKWLARELKRQASLTLREPTRFIRLSKEVFTVPGRLGRYARFLSASRGADSWRPADETGLRTRSYRSYEDYRRHQASKLEHIDLSDYDVWFRAALRERWSGSRYVRPGCSVLCLAARIGTEVRAFHDLGCFAVGIDLNPGPDNPHVLPGDFHALRFPDASVDLVYTNSMDHALDPRSLVREVRRVLKPGGIFLLEAQVGLEDGREPGQYEALWWERPEDLERLVLDLGFDRLKMFPFDRPHGGTAFVFRPNAARSAGPRPESEVG